MKEELLRLAERCEKATGPDDATDWAIGEAVGCAPGLPYTASLDAAMTLVPDGFDWAVHRHTLAKQASAHVYLVKEATPARTFAATPALALCAAALRASVKEQNNGG